MPRVGVSLKVAIVICTVNPSPTTQRWTDYLPSSAWNVERWDHEMPQADLSRSSFGTDLACLSFHLRSNAARTQAPLLNSLFQYAAVLSTTPCQTSNVHRLAALCHMTYSPETRLCSGSRLDHSFADCKQRVYYIDRYRVGQRQQKFPLTSFNKRPK